MPGVYHTYVGLECTYVFLSTVPPVTNVICLRLLCPHNACNQPSPTCPRAHLHTFALLHIHSHNHNQSHTDNQNFRLVATALELYVRGSSGWLDYTAGAVGYVWIYSESAGDYFPFCLPDGGNSEYLRYHTPYVRWCR